MSDPNFANISMGFTAFGIAVFLWASIDYNRFIKFWMLRPAPYSDRVKNTFRLFFLACVVGCVWQLVETVTASAKPALSYLRSLLSAGVWFAVYFLVLHVVEWMERRRSMKQSKVRSQDGTP
jgi:hypothetical protein